MGGGLAFIRHNSGRLTSYEPKCLGLLEAGLFMTSSPSMNAVIRILPRHVAHEKGSIFPDQARDKIQPF
jgi:hypothetical protein